MANKGSVNYLTFVFGLHELFFSLEGGGVGFAMLFERSAESP